MPQWSTALGPCCCDSSCPGEARPLWPGQLQGPLQSRRIATHLPSAGHFPTNKSTSASWLPLSYPAGLIALSTRPHPEGSSWSLFRFAGSELTPDTQLPLRTRSQGAQSPSELGLSSQGPNPLSLHQGLQTPLHLSAMPQKTCYPVPNLPLTFPYPPLHSLHISTVPF